MQNRTFIHISSAALVAAVLGFSGAGLAQQNAVRALDSQAQMQSSERAAPRDYSLASTLAADLDAFNRQDNASRGPSTHMPANHESHRVARQIRELGQDLDAYNANATRGRVVETHVPATEVAHTSDHARAEELADGVSAFNESGGNLNSVQNIN